MGSGKSTVGKELATSLKMQFLDLDNYIEKRNFKTIPEIFASEGESSFRKIEQKALHEVSEFDNVIIATGGGAPCFFDNMDLIKKTGVSIYLNGSSRILAERLLNSKIDRPLIKGKSKEELISFLAETLSKRNEWYRQADVILDFDHDISTEEVLNSLQGMI